MVQLAIQEKKLAAVHTVLERSKGLPEFSFGYFNSSIQGTGADNQSYSASKRFSSFQVGLGIPLFRTALKARQEASAVNEDAAETNYQRELHQMAMEYSMARGQYESSLQTVSYFEETALLNASDIISTANKQFGEGEINYLEWVMLFHQSLGIRVSYLDALSAFNKSVITLHYLTSKS
jgi:cobalt-zinc-cadmium resistance protein CzcA